MLGERFFGLRGRFHDVQRREACQGFHLPKPGNPQVGEE